MRGRGDALVSQLEDRQRVCCGESETPGLSPIRFCMHVTSYSSLGCFHSELSDRRPESDRSRLLSQDMHPW